MILPDYNVIAENILFSFGMNNARSLAQKIVLLHHLAAEQLSHQVHYHYGMRAMRAVLDVITHAGYIRNLNPKEQEEDIVFLALRQVHEPKFTLQDLTLFNSIVCDIFPEKKQQHQMGLSTTRNFIIPAE